MAKKKAKSKSPFVGRWQIVSMSAYDLEDEEESPFIEFGKDQQGNFGYGSVSGIMDWRETTRDGKPAAEWSWEGGDEDDAVTGRGWAVIEGDELHGMFFIHTGDESDFVAEGE